jgi:exoribonuclease-2
MQLLYEEGSEFRVAAVLAESPTSFQVETPHGRRAKVKTGQVLMQFERPAAAELLALAQRFADALDTDFLWQCSGAREFGFLDLAREYVGREPTPIEATGLLLKLHAAPMYFYRRGHGRFQAAPEETLKRAIAGQEKKRRTQEKVEAWTAQLARFSCPEEIAALKDELLYAPDRNKPETKAFEQACKQTGLSPARLLERCGLLADSHAYHLNGFLHEFFPRGTQFAAHPAPARPADLPLAEHAAFSLDDVGTTEIDDAFSVVRGPDGSLRVGVHIAAPALGFAPGSPIDAIARERLSTAYMPGEKFTMLPEDVVEHFSLDHGSAQPAVSLYVDVSADDFTIRGTRTRLERIPIAANLHHAEYDRLNGAFPAGTVCGLPFEDALRSLWQFACALEARRGKPAVNTAFQEFTISVADDRVAVRARAQAGGAARQAGGRADDLGQHRLGHAACRARRRGDLPRAILGQGPPERSPGGARRPRRVLLCVAVFAASPLRRSGEPVATRRRPRRPAAALRAQRRDAVIGDARFRAHARTLCRAPARDGVVLVPALAAAGARRACRGCCAARSDGPLRGVAALRGGTFASRARTRRAGANQHRRGRSDRAHRRLQLSRNVACAE